MKKVLRFNYLLYSIFLCFGCSTQASSIVGDWSLIEKNTGCPYSILFRKNGVYEILNDCYGFDPKLPIVEKGRFYIGNNEISFTKREIFSEYNFLGSNGLSSVKILSLNDKELVISVCSGVNNKCSIDRLIKRSLKK
ncbi:hypothetical protein NBRC116188_19640 [Oceaniserpentilla sp. 4NH20-0058]|uniref:hypothetical protein n=1 Tax=Oceaniserpentilla sp. 4NH20-0058 TaxID=3127660 RepID=UPI0031047ADC